MTKQKRTKKSGPRCIILFRPQAWINDYAVFIDGEQEIDVTDRIQALSREDALDIEDDSYEADALVEGLHNHRGPYYVECEDAIREFLGEK